MTAKPKKSPALLLTLFSPFLLVAAYLILAWIGTIDWRVVLSNRRAKQESFALRVWNLPEGWANGSIKPLVDKPGLGLNFSRRNDIYIDEQSPPTLPATSVLLPEAGGFKPSEVYFRHYWTHLHSSGMEYRIGSGGSVDLPEFKGRWGNVGFNSMSRWEDALHGGQSEPQGFHYSTPLQDPWWSYDECLKLEDDRVALLGWAADKGEAIVGIGEPVMRDQRLTYAEKNKIGRIVEQRDSVLLAGDACIDSRPSWVLLLADGTFWYFDHSSEKLAQRTTWQPHAQLLIDRQADTERIAFTDNCVCVYYWSGEVEILGPESSKAKLTMQDPLPQRQAARPAERRLHYPSELEELSKVKLPKVGSQMRQDSLRLPLDQISDTVTISPLSNDTFAICDFYYDRILTVAYSPIASHREH